ncbi:uncharacterized protein METZ01_LOCUS222462, partial [marine metagenome]
EHLLYTQGVRGSSPLPPTIHLPKTDLPNTFFWIYREIYPVRKS